MGANVDVQNGKNCDYVAALQKYFEFTSVAVNLSPLIN